MASAVSAMSGLPSVSLLFSRASASSPAVASCLAFSWFRVSKGKTWNSWSSFSIKNGTSGSFEPSGPVVTGNNFARRKLLLQSSVGFIAGVIPHVLQEDLAVASEFADMPAFRRKDYGKKMKYPDYTETLLGLQYKDLHVGEGPTPKSGETVVVIQEHHYSCCPFIVHN